MSNKDVAALPGTHAVCTPQPSRAPPLTFYCPLLGWQPRPISSRRRRRSGVISPCSIPSHTAAAFAVACKKLQPSFLLCPDAGAEAAGEGKLKAGRDPHPN